MLCWLLHLDACEFLGVPGVSSSIVLAVSDSSTINVFLTGLIWIFISFLWFRNHHHSSLLIALVAIIQEGRYTNLLGIWECDHDDDAPLWAVSMTAFGILYHAGISHDVEVGRHRVRLLTHITCVGLQRGAKPG